MEISSIKNGKKWLMGIDGSNSPIEIGYFEKAEDIYHYHGKVHEYYLMVEGSMTLMVEDKEVVLKEGDICYVEPGEKHMITGQTAKLKCFLAKYPHLPEDKIVC